MIPVPRVGRVIDLTVETQLPIEDRRRVDMTYQEMIRRSRTRNTRQEYHLGNPFGDRQDVFNIPYQGVPLFNICAVPASEKKVSDYTKYHLIRLAQQYVVEGNERKRITTEQVVTRLKSQGYKI